MSKFDEEMKPYYERFDKAFESNDIKEIAYLSQFTNKKDIRDWWRRQVCENMHANNLWKKAGYKGIALNEYGWHEWTFPDYERQETIKLGNTINRGCCNMKEAKAIGIMQTPNGKWVAKVDEDFSSIGHDHIRLGIHDTLYDTRTEAWNTALKEFIDNWHRRNPDVKKDDEAVKKAKSLIIVDNHFFENTSAKKGEAVQLELFTF